MTTACRCDYSVNFIIKTLEDTLTTQKTTWSKGTCSSESILEQTSRVQTAGQTGASCIGLLHNTQTCLTCSDGGDQLLAKSSDSHATVFWLSSFCSPSAAMAWSTIYKSTLQTPEHPEQIQSIKQLE